MNWEWPWVSRERLDEKTTEIMELRSELAVERQANRKLYNFMIWRTGGGVAPDLSLLPEAYRPQPQAPAMESKNGPQPVQRRRPGQARYDIAQFEVNKEMELQTGHTTPRIPEEQKAVVRELNDSANEATAV